MEIHDIAIIGGGIDCAGIARASAEYLSGRR
jgi:glycerol-3-phosphate dehydrogenase